MHLGESAIQGDAEHPYLFQLDSTRIYLYVDFFIFIYYILSTFQIIPVNSLATIFILENICQHIRSSDTLLLEILDLIFM